MKSRRVASFAEEGKWTSGADATMLMGDWQAWVDGEGHWKVRGPDPDNEAHYADGDIVLTEAEYIEAGNSEVRRKIRAQRAKKAARAYIQSMVRASKVHQHATRKKSPSQLDREIAEVLGKPSARGSSSHRAHATLKASVDIGDEVYAVSSGRRHGPGIVEEIYSDGSMRVDFTRQLGGRLRIRPEDLIATSSTKAHSSMKTSLAPSQLHVGQRFDHFGHTYEILKIGRDKNRTVQIARPHTDRFGKVAFIDHRSFPAREFDRQHLRLLAD